MPVFEYKCQECGEEFEELVFGQNPDVACVKCNSKKVKTEKRPFMWSFHTVAGTDGLRLAAKLMPNDSKKKSSPWPKISVWKNSVLLLVIKELMTFLESIWNTLA